MLPLLLTSQAAYDLIVEKNGLKENLSNRLIQPHL